MVEKPDGDLCGLVAIVDDVVGGWIEVAVERWVQEEAYAHIGGLVVRDGMRGKNIGQKLCEAGEAWALEKGVRWMRVHSRVTRPDAHRFYLRDGYEHVKTSEVFAKRLG
jgi:GNAT superfamily N-acetyltransferase